MRVVETMHERKALMADLSNAFLILPGGFGTLDEFFECVTWAQLGFHEKPIGVLNSDRYFDPLLAFLRHAVDEGFVRREHLAHIVVDTSVDALLDRLLG
jgi:uncharacterized protein (TIGR00730 family)